jgi:tRNA dimethylallyltransferase
MDIGTAKPSLAERQRLPHHVIDVVDPDEPYTLALYQRQALAAVADIVGRRRLPVLVGGAGLYVSAVCDGLAMPDVPPDHAFRQLMEQRARVVGIAALQRDLAAVDPISAQRIEPRNVRRVIRALEVFHATGKPFSFWQTPEVPPVRSVRVGLQLERQALYARIDRRIDEWIAGGLVDEVRGLLERGYSPQLPSMSGIGYRQLAQYLRGELDLAEAVAQLKQATHLYAKRQMTWFGRDQRVHWLDAATATPEQVLDLLGAALD